MSKLIVEFFDDYDDAFEAWTELVDYHKNEYQFGGSINLPEFKRVMKVSYKYLSEKKKKIIDGTINKNDMFNYVSLVSIISRYIKDASVDDMSKDHMFTVTCLLADALAQFAQFDFVNELDVGVDEEHMVYDCFTGNITDIKKYVNKHPELYEQ